MTRKHLYGWFDWLVPLQAYKLLLRFSSLQCSLFYQTSNLHQATSGSRSLILLVVSQQTHHQSLHAFNAPLLHSILWPRMLIVEQVLAADHGRYPTVTCMVVDLLIATSMSYQLSQKSHLCHNHCQVINLIALTGLGRWGVGLNKFHRQYKFVWLGLYGCSGTKFANLDCCCQTVHGLIVLLSLLCT